MRQDMDRIERELMLLGRHTATGSIGRCGGPAEDRLERSAYLLLSRIEAQGPMSIGQLAEALRLDCSTVNRQTAAALRAGLLERIPDPEGGLARKLRVTDEGLRRLRRDRDERINGLSGLLNDWSPRELAAFARVLTRFNATVEREEGEPWPRSDQPRPTALLPLPLERGDTAAHDHTDHV
ncbi:MarR family winged helix-turn-helix transcriptional regulator [Streptomyces litchfieldiae]|uniref:MarR family transcriptional regulator n=1 Tax=Streptomyces litchfieldiae TaxID=3075543 RepID=A0ABU2MPI3_9ACTN|nr:MarR family transcriptional regulator [Streptomyces sp. DSM 44938]MDT0343526.1 MarR family transcriptional regulator [Streptomyces sp. DSM 44938]